MSSRGWYAVAGQPRGRAYSMAVLFASDKPGSSKPTAKAWGTGATDGVQRLRVLVVEDNLDQVHTLSMLMKLEGHEVDFAINGYAAIDIAESFKPDVVLLDLGLPGLDGFEVCKRIEATLDWNGYASSPLLAMELKLPRSGHAPPDATII